MHINRFEGDTDDGGRLSPARIRAYFHYDPVTGYLTFREPRGHRSKVGRRTGYVRKGRSFREIKVDRHAFREDRVIWAHITGRWPRPGHDIVHVNGDLADSSLENLKEERVLRSMARGIKNACGFIGVVPIRGRFAARIKRGRKDCYLGTYDTPEQAHQVYLQAALAQQTERDLKARGLVFSGENAL